MALWRNVQGSGGGPGAFVHRLKSGFDLTLLPEPNSETPGFCPVCGAEVSMRYGVGSCPNGHELRVCDVCGELAPAGEACPWCGAEPEEGDEPLQKPFGPEQVPAELAHSDAARIWSEVLARIQVRVPHLTYSRWFEGTTGRSLKAGILTVRVPGEHVAGWLEAKFKGKVLEILGEMGIEVEDVKFSPNGKEVTA